MEEENEWLTKSLCRESCARGAASLAFKKKAVRADWPSYLGSPNAQWLAFYVRNKRKGLLLQNSFSIFDALTNVKFFRGRPSMSVCFCNSGTFWLIGWNFVWIMYLVCSIVMIFKNQTKCPEVSLEGIFTKGKWVRKTSTFQGQVSKG